jgi:hypothetical protein
MGGAMGGGGSGGGSTANVYTPRSQGAADASLQQLILPLLGLSANAGAGTPAAQNLPAAQSAIYGDLLNPGFQNQAIAGSQAAADSAFNRFAPQAFSGADQLFGASTGGLPFANQALAQGFDPRYEQMISGIQDNPYYGQALGGAQAAAGMGATGANAMMGMGGQIAGTINPLLESGFDPRSALFNRTQGRLMDQTNAINAMSGLGGTPYGASVGANAMGNFDIDWQNQQLARQAQAAGAAGNAANTAGGLYGAAPGLMASTAGLPSGVYTGRIGQELQALQARNQAANQGIAGYGSLLGTAGQGIGQANQANLQGAQAYQQYGSAPYNTASGIANNSLTGLNNLTALGNNQFQLPQQEIGNLMQYMGLGQSASGLSGQLGNLGFQQTAQGLGGALSGANTLFGQGGMFGGGGGLFGGGAPALTSAGTFFGDPAAATAAGFAFPGSAAAPLEGLVGGADLAAGGGGGGLLSMLPFSAA